MKHKHIFKSNGGGCFFNPQTKVTEFDNSYKCDCGETFSIYTKSESIHFTLPKVIKCKPEPKPIKVDLPKF